MNAAYVTHTLCIRYAYATHTVHRRYIYATHMLRIRYAYATYTLRIRYAYVTHTHKWIFTINHYGHPLQQQQQIFGAIAFSTCVRRATPKLVHIASVRRYLSKSTDTLPDIQE